jgi:hypothetical protein
MEKKIWLERFSPTEVVDRISEGKYESNNIFKLGILVVFITTMIGCWKNGKCQYAMLKYFLEGKDISEYDWCGFILDSINKCKENWIREDKACWFVGPLTILTVHTV